MKPLCIAGDFEVRLATTGMELDAAQALRYHIFYDEMGARPTIDMERARRDYDKFDEVCDHLIVVDTENRETAAPFVVGNYRLLRRTPALKDGYGFYTAREFNLDGLMKKAGGEVLELGRSCVHPAYRARGVMQIMWRGLAEYCRRHNVLMMFGCASFAGTDPEVHAEALSYLYHNHSAPSAWRPRAHTFNYVNMNRVEKDSLTRKEAFRQLPPLIKGYLRAGGVFGDGAVVDTQFNTLDVCVMVETDRVAGRYQKHYLEAGSPAWT